MRDCIYTIRCERARWIGPLRLRNVRCGLFTYTNVYPRAPTVMRGCIYTIRVDGRDESVPYAYGMYAATVYAQPMFIPRTRNIYPRTPTFTPRAPTVGADLSCPHITECMLQLFMRSQCLFHEYMIFVLVHPLWYGGVICIIQCGHSLFHLFCFSFVP